MFTTTGAVSAGPPEEYRTKTIEGNQNPRWGDDGDAAPFEFEVTSGSEDDTTLLAGGQTLLHC